MSSAEWNEAPGARCTQWSGQSTCCWPPSSTMSPGTWPGLFEAKLPCSTGCQSCVATTRLNRGISAFATGTTASPSATGSAPKGMKSFWMSTSSNARMTYPLFRYDPAGRSDQRRLSPLQAEFDADLVGLRVQEPQMTGVERRQLIEGTRADLLDRRLLVDEPSPREDRHEQLP